MFKKAVLIFGLLLIGWRPAGAQHMPFLPPAVQADLDQALEMAGVAYAPYEMKKIDQAGRSFSQLLDRIGRLIDPAQAEQAAVLEGQDIRAKLVTIAWDRRRRPEVYEEIEREYLEKVHNLTARLPRSPSLRPEHQAEKYRLPWEYILLRPPLAGSAAFYDGNARNALAAIGHPASILTLVHNYRMTAQGDLSSNPQIEARQRLLLGGLRAFPDEQGLRAILECLSLSEQQWRRSEAAGQTGLVGRWDVAGYISALLKTANWQKVIAAVSKQGLSPEQRQWLERIR